MSILLPPDEPSRSEPQRTAEPVGPRDTCPVCHAKLVEHEPDGLVFCCQCAGPFHAEEHNNSESEV